MDPDLRAVAEQIARDVSNAVTARVTAAVTANVTKNISTHVSDVVGAAEQRLADQARINVEAVKAEARLVADNYGGVLQSIDSRLSRLESDLSRQFRQHEAILAEAPSTHH